MFSFLRPGSSAAKPDIAQIAQEVAEGRMLLLDVREVAEAKASGLAKDARLIPLSLLPLKADPRQPGCELPQGLPVAVYCASGARSGMAADVLGRMGYGPVVNLGGLRDWAQGGGAVVAY
ncbi:rhodanese-like domain-containing protein [Tabrizicola aquatica]|uniref:rhodanese-like domain-containing protein n=1 Tax=Tabrizicola aquatica TaxID=909926 RepID=UPI000CD24281|nr:rhodanese-like domain-containing protein [Tabrizicola aquatica]